MLIVWISSFKKYKIFKNRMYSLTNFTHDTKLELLWDLIGFFKIAFLDVFNSINYCSNIYHKNNDYYYTFLKIIYDILKIRIIHLFFLKNKIRIFIYVAPEINLHKE